MLKIVSRILYNEECYLKEWVDFHIKQGCVHFYIYIIFTDTIKGATKNNKKYKYIVNKYKAYDNITFTHIRWSVLSPFIYFFRNVKLKDDDWVALLDIDEFLYSPLPDKKVTDIIKIYEDKKIYAICVNWLCFGSNNLEDNKDFKILEKFTKCSKKCIWNSSFKSLVKVSAFSSSPINFKFRTHRYNLKPGFEYYTSTGISRTYFNKINKKETLNPKQVAIEDNPFLIINHYIVKSKSEFMGKIQNNPNRSDRYNLKKFNNYNKILNKEDNFDILTKL